MFSEHEMQGFQSKGFEKGEAGFASWMDTDPDWRPPRLFTHFL